MLSSLTTDCRRPISSSSTSTGIEEQILDGAAAVLASGSLRPILVEVT
jgi:hypothetical protein